MKNFTNRLLVICLLLAFCTTYSYSQNGQVFTKVTGKLIRTTPRLADIDQSNVGSLEKTRDENGLIGMPSKKDANSKIHAEWFPSKRDGLIKGTTPGPVTNSPNPSTATAVINSNFNGLTTPGIAPSDNVLAAGPNHVIQMINNSSSSLFKIWDKAGTQVQAQIVLSTITGITGAGDPIVVYDQLADRWILNEFGRNPGSSGFINTLIFAVSATADPTGSWNVYSFTDNTFFVDYQKVAVWHNAYYATSNDFNTAATAYLGSSIYAFDRAAMLAGAPTAASVRTRLTSPVNRFFSMSPVCLEGNTASNQSGLFAFLQDDAFTSNPTDVDSIFVFEFTPNFTTPASSVIGTPISMASAPFNQNVPALNQQGSSQTFQSLAQRLMYKVIYRNFGASESIVCNTTSNVGSGRAGVHWWELRRPGSGNWSIHQQGVVAPSTDANHRFMGAIAINAARNIGLAYNVTGSTSFPSFRFTGRNDCDPLGTMTLPEMVIMNGTTFNGTNRYGDYNTLTVDPSNGSFWGTGQYNATGFGTFGNWVTRIANFTLAGTCIPTPALNAAGATLVAETCAPANGVLDPNEQVTVSFCIQNTGTLSTTNLVGTLEATGGVTSPGSPQNFGVVTMGGPAVCRSFTFTPNTSCGGSITATIQLQDGATNLGTVTYTFTTGVPVVTFTQNFDAVVAPALPAGWTTDFTGAGTAFTTSTTNAFSAPNAAFGTETSTTGVTNLNSPTIAITSANAQLSFRNLFNLEAGFDGEVLEIKIGAGAFQDIITAGGSFVSGGYTGSLDASGPLPNRSAWTDLSGGTTAVPTYINTVVNLPAAAAGQSIQLRWRVGSDVSLVASGAPGVRIDNININDGATCCIPAAGPTVTINQAVAQIDPTATSPINFTVVFSETVTGFATGDVTLSGTAGATTATVTGSGTTYNVEVSGMTANGTVIASIPAGVATNGASQSNSASTSTDNSVTFNGIPPTVTINQAVTQVDPTVISPINFTVVFNEAVTGFATGDVTLSGTAGATTATVTGSGTTYNVAVSGMTGTGTVIADIAAGVAINAGGVGNLAATFTDHTVTFNNTPPTVTINQAVAQDDPTTASPINFTVVFNEPVTGFATGDVVLSGTAGATTATVTGSGTIYNVAVTGMTASGTVIATIPVAVAIDIDNNDNLASTSTDNNVTFNSCVLTCPANITVNNTTGQCGAIVNYPAPTSTAGCGTVTSVPASGSFFPIGTTTVNVTTTAGATCSFTITVNDTEAPTITCPADIVVSNTANQCGAIVNFAPIAADNCPIGTTTPRNLTQSASNTVTPLGSVGCAALGLHTDNSYWRAYNLAPLSLVGPLTINTVSFGIETADAAGAGTTQPVTVRLHTSAGAFPGGVRTLVGSQTFNIPDQTNSLFTGTLTTPVTVPANAILVLEIFTPNGQTAGNSFFLGTNSGAETGPSYISAADCGITTPVTTASIGFPNARWILNAAGTVPVPGSGTVSVPASGSFFPVGITTVTSTATDGAGNTATCTFTVRVNDTQAPVITCPANITVTTAVGSCVAPVTYAVTATDNCPGVTTALTAGLASGANFPVGVNTVTYRATDAAGNISTCSFTVTVLDGQLPVINTQPVNRTVCTGTNAVFSVTATSLSPLSYQWQQYIAGVWTNIAGATGSTLTLNGVNISMNTNSYRVNVIGLCTTVTSGFASLYVNSLPVVNLSASNAPVLLPGQTTNIVATVSPTGGTFAWFKNGAALVPAVTVGTLSNLAVENVGTYRLQYTDLNGCVNTSADLVVSAQASDRLFIAPNPNFGQFSVRYYNQLNEQLTLSVFNSNGARVYQKQVTTTLAYTRMDVDLGLNAPGVYIVRLHNSAGKLLGQKKIIVSHR
jgi:HYR domain/Secretion system C-terminal sorting domain